MRLIKLKIIPYLQKFLSKNRLNILGIFSVVLFYDIFLNPKFSDFLTLILIALWVSNIFNLKISSMQSLLMAALTYLLAIIAQSVGGDIVMEKSMSWSVVFLMFFLIQRLMKMSGGRLADNYEESYDKTK